MRRDPVMPGNSRGLLWLAALAYTAFVVYGSLVPLEFRAIPLGEAVSPGGFVEVAAWWGRSESSNESTFGFKGLLSSHSISRAFDENQYE